MKSNGNYWIDENNNTWTKTFYSEEVAEKFSGTLVNCNYCINCSNCSNCFSCRNCRDCIDCIYCRDCSNCRHCSHCSDCSNCSNCFSCRNCRYCSHCSDCRNWRKNPERIYSSRIGSRKDQTRIYFDSTRTQVICGCFGENEIKTLEEFEEKVKEKYPDINNSFRNEYLKFIEKVKIYRS